MCLKNTFISLTTIIFFLKSLVTESTFKSSDYVLFSLNNTLNFKLSDAFIFENVMMGIQKSTSQMDPIDCISTPTFRHLKAISYEERENSIAVCGFYSDYPQFSSDVALSDFNRSRIYIAKGVLPNYRFNSGFLFLNYTYFIYSISTSRHKKLNFIGGFWIFIFSQRKFQKYHFFCV